MLRKICGLFLIFTMMLGLSTSVFADSERIQEYQKDDDKYIQEYKGVKYDIRMNSAPKDLLNSIDLKTDESVELNSNAEKPNKPARQAGNNARTGIEGVAGVAGILAAASVAYVASKRD